MASLGREVLTFFRPLVRATCKEVLQQVISNADMAGQPIFNISDGFWRDGSGAIAKLKLEHSMVRSNTI